jgi:hypothetical protein
MQFVHVDPARIEREWPVYAEILAPAVRSDPRQTLEGLRKRLAAGADSLLEVAGPGHCLIVLEVSSDLVCWTKYLAGTIEGGPKARLAIMRQAIEHIEAVARAAGCTEHRLCGRDSWARILPDYRPFEGHPNGLTKELQ